MRKSLRTLLLPGAILLLFCTAHAQVSTSDNPAYLHAAPSQLVPVQRTHAAQAMPCNSPGGVTNVSLCDSGAVVLTASGATNYAWTNAMDSLVSSSSSYTTPVIQNTTVYYAAAVCDTDTAMMNIPVQSTIYTGSIRGYWFTAPCNFTITGLRVPLDNTGAQTIEVVRFTAGPPPVFSSTTNSFVVLGYWNGVNTTTVIDTNIAVASGDIIGIYGWRGTTNSYSAAGDYATTIAGHPTTLQRSGMQDDLNVNMMHDIWSEVGGSISRVEMYYALTDTSAPVADTIFVHQSAHVTASSGICQGDSIFLGGNYQSAAGTYYDTLSTVTGCDSVITTTLTVNPLPVVTATAFSNPNFCVQDNPVALPSATPAGGTWSGPGVSSNNFDPGAAGVGSYFLVYTYADSLGCTSSDSIPVSVGSCTGIASNASPGNIRVYPNPATDQVHVVLHGMSDQSTVQLLDLTGRVLGQQIINGNGSAVLDLSGFAKGEYMIRVTSSDAVHVTRITRL